MTQALILENYTSSDQKAILTLASVFMLMGSLELIVILDTLFKFLVITLVFFALFYLLTFLFGKKGLLFYKNELYYGIAINNRFLIKRKVKLSSYSKFVYQRKVKTQGNWFLDLQGYGIFYNIHECVVFLTTPTNNKRKLLIALTDIKLYEEVKSFLIQTTNLKELEQKVS